MENKVKIHNREIQYNIDYRNVKYSRLEFKTGNLILILPKNYKKEKELIEKHKKWIYKKAEIISNALKKSKSKKLVNRSKEEFRNFVKSTAKKFLKELNLQVNKIYFRKMNSKWASCSSEKNLTLNTLLSFLPNKLIEYVIYHEILHLKERKHNKLFWKIISEKFKDYENKEKELFVYWFLIQNSF